MRPLNLVLMVLVVTGMALLCSGCTVKIENVTRNATSGAAQGPSNLPQYPDANRTSYFNARFAGRVFTYETNDTPKQVIDFYKTQMQARGYNISTSLMNTNQSGGVLIFSKSNDIVFVGVGQSNGKTNFVVRTSFQA